MKIFFRMLLVAALAALGVWLWAVLFPSPEKVIGHRFAELARTASVPAGAGDLARLAAARSLAGFFSTNVEMNLDLPRFGQLSSMDREEITQMALAAGSRGGGLQVRFPDINITVAPGRQSAVVDLTVTAVVAGEPDTIVQEMKITLHKIDGQWLITRVETVRTLS
ncbi:MAG: hypothetical protein WAO02_09235 [Verrucomicrobiia bacterium]